MKLIFLGPPGAGKGTMATRLAEKMSIPHISTGDIFRKAIKEETELGLKVKGILAAGDLVPDELTVELVEERLEQDDAQNGYILDGFPRTIPQAEALAKSESIDKVVNFAISDEAVVKRLSGRRVAPTSGKIYHVVYNPPKTEGKCDESGEDLITRPDDQPEAIQNRLEVYKKQTEPLISYYTKQNLKADVNADQPVDKEFDDLLELLRI